MVIKYSTCEFTDNKIAPGHGVRYVEVNGKSHLFLNHKVISLFRHGKKPLSIRWSLKWRTAHKKGKAEESKKRISKQKKEKHVKAIVGLSIEEINKIKESLKDDRINDATRFKYAQEIKDKRKKFVEKQRRIKGDSPVDKKAQQNVKTQAPKPTQKGRGKN